MKTETPIIKTEETGVYGHGAFAKEFIAKGTILRIGPSWVFINHRCKKQNLKVLPHSYDGRPHLRHDSVYRAVRDICPEEEVTVNYGKCNVKKDYPGHYENIGIADGRCLCTDCRESKRGIKK